MGTSSMPSAFHFTRIAGSGETVYQVRLDGHAGRLIGSVTDHGDYWQASVEIIGKLHTRPFPDRDKAAAWLLSIAPRMKR